MTATLDSVRQQAFTLSQSDRAELVRDLITLDSEGEPKFDARAHKAAWAAVIKRRIAEIESGEVQGIPLDDVMREMREKYP